MPGEPAPHERAGELADEAATGLQRHEGADGDLVGLVHLVQGVMAEHHVEVLVEIQFLGVAALDLQPTGAGSHDPLRVDIEARHLGALAG